MIGGTLRRKISILVNMDAKKVPPAIARINKSLDKLKRIGKAVFKVLTVAALAFVVAFALILKGVLQTGIQFEKFGIQLKVLFGSARKGEKAFQWIKDFAKATPFALEKVVDAFVRLRATGLDAADNNLLRDMGDLAAAAQKPLEQVTEAVSNIASGLVGVGIKQVRQLNISNQMLEKQGVIFNSQGRALTNNFEIIKAIQRVVADQNFAGLMDEQAKTIGGILTNIMDAWTQIKGALAFGIFPVIRKDLEKIRDSLFDLVDSGKAADFGKQVGAQLSKIIFFLKAELPKLFRQLKNTWNTEIKPLLSFIWDQGLIKKAAIILIFTKVLKIAKEIALTMRAVGVAAVGTSLGKRALAGIGIGATTATAGFAGTAASGGVSAAVAAALPVILAVLATAAVGFAIFKTVGGFVERSKDSTIKAPVVPLSVEGQKPLSKREQEVLADINANTFKKGFENFLSSSASLSDATFTNRVPLQFSGTATIGAPQEGKINEELRARVGIFVALEELTKRSIEQAEKQLENSKNTESFDNERRQKLRDILKLEDQLSLVGLSTLDRKLAEVELERTRELIRIEGLKSLKNIEGGLQENAELAQIANDKFDKQKQLLIDIHTATELIKATEQSRLDILDAQNAGIRALQEIQGQTSDINFATSQAEAELQGVSDFELRKREIMRETHAMQMQIALDETFLVTDKLALMLALEEQKNAKLKALGLEENKADKTKWFDKEKTAIAGYQTLLRAGEAWARGEINLQNAVKLFAISAVGDTTAAILDNLKQEAEVRALMALGKGQFGNAALFFTAAAAAGTAASAVRAQTQSVIDRSIDFANPADASAAQAELDGSGSSTRSGAGSVQSGFVTRGVDNIFISPSVTFQGEIVVVGSDSVAEIAATIGDIAVESVRQAIDTGELNIVGTT